MYERASVRACVRACVRVCVRACTRCGTKFWGLLVCAQRGGGELQFILNGVVARVTAHSWTTVKLHLALLPFVSYVLVFVLISILWVRTTRRTKKVRDACFVVPPSPQARCRVVPTARCYQCFAWSRAVRHFC